MRVEGVSVERTLSIRGVIRGDGDFASKHSAVKSPDAYSSSWNLVVHYTSTVSLCRKRGAV